MKEGQDGFNVQIGKDNRPWGSLPGIQIGEQDFQGVEVTLAVRGQVYT
ncbi:MAG: hypothetical protein HY747_09865 [Elusimicrobia bacterium]|nr:hypothetical protein [Elusimicrobiota bacterium]